MAGYTGRGAWPANGAGGTLQYDRTTKATKPGRYYTLSSVPAKLVGLAAYKAIKLGGPVDLNELAVHYGVKAIQARLIVLEYTGIGGASLVPDGIFGKHTDTAIRAFQAKVSLTSDGLIGPSTSKALWMPYIKAAATTATVDLICGHIAMESLMDPGAVGGMDANDLGLGQINGPAHPEFSIEDRFNPIASIKFVAGLVASNVKAFSNLRDSIAAYNLGQGGCRSWIAAGRPEWWVPVGSTASRNVWRYIDSVETAC